MSTVHDGAFDLDAALVLVRVDPRRGCAELHRLLAGEVAAYSRALGVTEVADHVDAVLDRMFTTVTAFAGHGRDFRISVLRTATEIAHEHLGGATGTELGAAVLLGVLGCSVEETAAITGRSTAVVESNRPGATTARYHRRRFSPDEPPAPGPAVAAHLGPRPQHVPPSSDAEASPPTDRPRSRRHRRAALIAAAVLAALAVTAQLVGADNDSDELTTSQATRADVIVANVDPAPNPEDDPDASDDGDEPDTPEEPAAETTGWSHDVADAGRVFGTIDDRGELHATVEPAPGWTVELDDDTPPWIHATFTNGRDRIRFLAIADDGVVRVWIFDLDGEGPDDQMAAPPATPRPPSATPEPTPAAAPTPRPPRESATPAPDTVPPEGDDDVANPAPTPTPDPTTPRPAPDEADTKPTPAGDEATPTPDEPDTTPTPDEPDTTPTPDEPDPDRSGNSGRGGGSRSDEE